MQSQLGYPAPEWDRINIIYREYRKGGKLKPHLDRVNIFDEKIFNCVLENTSGSQLVLHPPQGSNEADLVMHEEIGTCLGMTDKARYVWTHGVPPLSRGTRKSLSWRYLLDNATTDTGHSDIEPQMERPPSIERQRKSRRRTQKPRSVLTKLIILSLCDGIGAVPWAAETPWPGQVTEI